MLVLFYSAFLIFQNLLTVTNSASHGAQIRLTNIGMRYGKTYVANRIVHRGLLAYKGKMINFNSYFFWTLSEFLLTN